MTDSGEDAVEYWIFIAPFHLDKEQAEAHKMVFLSFLEKWTKDYLWQYDGLDFKVVDSQQQQQQQQQQEQGVGAHLYGKSRYGDNLEDEWFITWLLLQLTVNFPEAIVKLRDDDGEFILIETAEVLPKWVKPDCIENRVLLSRGLLHIVPHPRHPGEVGLLPSSTNASLSSTLKAVASSPLKYLDKCCTLAPEKVQLSLQARFDGYPQKPILESKHYVSVTVPVACAKLLHSAPSMVSAAVRALYYRDVDDMSAAGFMKRFGVKSGGEMVSMKLRLSRCLYAQLLKQPFHSPKCMPMPPVGVAPPNIVRRAELGMKLACALEMVYQKNMLMHEVGNIVEWKELLLAKDSEKENEDGVLKKKEAFANSNIWKKFHCNLGEIGYYRGEKEGSQLYQKLKNSAFEDLWSKKKEEGVFDADVPIAEFMELGIKRAEMEGVRFLDKDAKIENEFDDDSWLDIDAESLERMLNERNNNNKKKESNESENLEGMVKSMGAFVQKLSGVDGVEVPDMSQNERRKDSVDNHNDYDDDGDGIVDSDDYDSDNDDDDNDDDDDDDGSSSGYNGSDDEDVSFDVDKILTVLRRTMNDKKENDEEDDDEEEDGDDEAMEFREMMEAMDRELKEHHIGDEFDKKGQRKAANNNNNKSIIPEEEQVSDDADDDDDDDDVDLDVNLINNILRSHEAQVGMPGPASNLYGLMKQPIPNIK